MFWPLLKSQQFRKLFLVFNIIITIRKENISLIGILREILLYTFWYYEKYIFNMAVVSGAIKSIFQSTNQPTNYGANVNNNSSNCKSVNSFGLIV